jgi:Clp protease
MHQPPIAGRGITGQATDLAIHAAEIERVKGELNRLIAQHTGQPVERVERDTDRDYFLSPEEAIDYGLIDGIIEAPPKVAAAIEGAASRVGATRASPSDPSHGSRRSHQIGRRRARHASPLRVSACTISAAGGSLDDRVRPDVSP